MVEIQTVVWFDNIFYTHFLFTFLITWLMFVFLDRYNRMVGKLCVDHKLESCYCIHGDASRIAGNIWYDRTD